MARSVFLRRGGVEYGPFEFNEVQEILRNGGFKPQDQMRRDGESAWKPAGSFLKTLGIVAAVGAGGFLVANLMNSSASAAETGAAAAGGLTPTGQWDVDNDGIADVETYDVNGDGVNDLTVFADRNGDGIAGVGLDTNNDGIADVGFADTNGDGWVDTEIYDTNFDGIPDVAVTDIDSDGIADVATSLSEEGNGIIAGIGEFLSGLFS